MQQNDIFQSTITNDETAALPAAQFGGRIIVVDTEARIEEACRDLASHKVIGFDTETRPSFRAGAVNRVALLQLSVPGRCYLFRLCRIKLDKPILRILESRSIVKVGAAVAGDLAGLRQLRHFRDGGFVDLQTVAPEWGIEEKSLRKLSAIVLGKKISKAQRLSNWEAVTLTEPQKIYAATDAWACAEIYERLQKTPKTKRQQ
ncbi:MAG: 3'-5' exonuclease domain-containing protein 2 [Alistipes sp.]|nr:3'-5' exonuclease domain-containing protein 2 [Alistipes sp.]MDE6778302.1 3'-5' exonuclease domain-containing protein 2 [Alistipes sp.]